MDIREHNRAAWNAQVERGNRWTIPVSAHAIEAARNGHVEIFLTPTKTVPRSWLGQLAQQRVLCLASGGGQQAPLLAAAGARVTVLDNAPRQLEHDARLAREHGLTIETVLGDMADLSRFHDDTYDLVVHPVSNCFVPDVRPVWAEAFRVLRRGGCLLSGFNNPIVYVFDQELAEHAGRLEVRHRLPYADTEALGPEVLDARRGMGVPLEFSHTLEALVGGQMAAGFVLTALYEDSDLPADAHLLNKYTSIYIATSARKPDSGTRADNAQQAADEIDNPPMPLAIRSAKSTDLDALRRLYTHLHPIDDPLPEALAIQRWKTMLAQPGFTCLLGLHDLELVSSCCLAVIPNLTRGGRPYALIENVVTDEKFRRRGFGRTLVREAVRLAWEAGCYKTMLLTGSQRPAVHRFYESCGFHAGEKTGFVARPA